MEEKSRALYTATYDNGVLIQVRLYTPAPPGYPAEDRIQLLIQPGGGQLRSGTMMTVEEAGHLIRGLRMALTALGEEDGARGE